MAQYLPPLNLLPIFNSDEFNYADDPISVSTGNGLYIKKSGADTAIGPLTLNNQILLASGIATAPSYTFSTDMDTGLYLSAANTLAFATAGLQRFNISTTKTTTNLNLVVPSGTSSNCGIQASTSANTGLVLGTSTLNLVSGGTTVANYTPTVLTNTCQIRNQNGTAASPSYSFATQSNMGIHYVGTNIMGLGVGGLKVLELGLTGLTFTSSGVSGASPTVLNYYESFTFATTWWFGAGSSQSASVNILITRVGDVCTAVIPVMNSPLVNNSGFTANMSTNSNLPTRFLPTGTGDYNAYQIIVIELGGVRQYGLLQVLHSAGFTIWNALRTQWANGASLRISDPLIISWRV